MPQRRKNNWRDDAKRFKWMIGLVMVLGCLALSTTAQAQTLTAEVIGVNKKETNPAATDTTLTDYRWVLEEDATYHVTPGVPDPNTLAVGFHSSYMPVVAKGNTTDPTTTQLGDVTLDPAKHYYLSVLPTTPGTYSIGGAAIAPGQTNVTVYLNQNPIPTAQITVFIFG